MAENHSGSGVVFRRALAVVAALALLTSLAQVAVAEPGTEEKLDTAKAEFEQLKDQIASQQQVLNRLSAEAAAIAERWEVATGRWEQVTAELRQTQFALAEAQAEYQGLKSDLEERAREAYITGPGSGLEFLLGASSIADLSARMEYVNALSQEDADLATEVQNVRNTLAARKEDQQKLQAKRAKTVKKIEGERAALDAKFGEQQAVLGDLNSAKARAEDLVKQLTRRYQNELEALTGLQFHGGSVFAVCPVDQPRALYDGFGAPRYGGGYHPHAGNDIIAPQGTPIRATFDGYAQAGSNTLGGYSVNVYGDLGYTYNAHLMQPGVTGQVSAGQVVGYVGATGDTSTPHDHFEWHPNVIPSDWPVSPYGYSIIGSAVNPFPLLAQVC
ncbi:MAG TPA: peptidoglycan DD-metalloendopeptidase family protein [Actinomycetota bacterium]|nr:peptidoglycan DD-metalloendopeptidase family protein [Actinomycetota bacterium]